MSDRTTMRRTRAKPEREDLTSLRCWECHGQVGGDRRCPKCSGTGRLFWVNGYAYPYTPEGEKRARQSA